MSTRGTHVAVAIAVIIAFLLPKRVECGYPDAADATNGPTSRACRHAGRGQAVCTDFEVEPLGLYLIELVVRRNVGFAYSSGDDCS